MFRRVLNRQSRGGKPSLKGQLGQIVIEYALLLVIAVSLAAILTKFLIGRGEGSEGLIIKVWAELSDQIGKDKADDVEAPK